MRVVIATVQVPYLAGGAEALAEGLKAAIAARGHPTEIVTLPFRFFPPAEVERCAHVWEGEDLTHLNLYEPDRIVCLKFPAYGLKHPDKALWLCHQHRAAYDLFDPEHATSEERALKGSIEAFDAKHLSAMAPRFTISKRVSERLQRFSGISSEPIYHPPPAAGDHYGAPAQPYVFFPSRIEHAKRQELVVRAMKHVRGGVSAVFAGQGGQSGALKELAEKLGVADRVRFVGAVTRDEMLALYANASAVCFTPLDEDYGYVTLEAMLSSKPVVTCADSGGPLEFVVDGETGLVVAADPGEVARAIERLLGEPARASRMGRAGRARYNALVPGWDKVADTLLAPRAR